MNRVLFDENVPRRLRLNLQDFEIRTTQEEGWSGLTNGELLREAQKRFDVLVTLDRRLQFQQNISSFSIGVVVVASGSNRLHHLKPLANEIRRAIMASAPGTVTVVSAV